MALGSPALTELAKDGPAPRARGAQAVTGEERREEAMAHPALHGGEAISGVRTLDDKKRRRGK
jgi:hypothetical protein